MFKHYIRKNLIFSFYNEFNYNDNEINQFKEWL